MKRYGALAERPLDKALLGRVLIEPCVKELLDKLEIPSKGMFYKR